MRLSVVNKIIFGFAGFGCLLLMTSVLSYLGLSGIVSSAKNVIEQKMPIQTQMNEVNTDILTLATDVTNGYHETERSGFSQNHEFFKTRSMSLIDKLDNLSVLLGNSAEATAAIEASHRFVEESNAMYGALQQQLILNEELSEAYNTVFLMADEASALMLDLSYVKTDSPDVDAIILGMTTTMDNKLLTLSNTIEDLAAAHSAQIAESILSDLNYQISNLNVDKDYLNNLAENADTQSIVAKFNEQFDAMVLALTRKGGVADVQQQKLTLSATAIERYHAAKSALEIALQRIEVLYSNVSAGTLNAQQRILSTATSAVVQTSLVFGVGLIAAVILGVIITRSIARPLVNINRSLKQLSLGDLSQKLDQSGSDEFASLASKINLLTDSLRSLVGNILAQEQRLETVTQSSIALGERSLKQVGEQRQQVQNTAKNTQDVRETSRNNLIQITTALDKLNLVETQSQSASELVENNRQQVLSQAQQAESSAQVVSRLDNNSRKIETILDVIKTIAEQTNLLALNAAIEAARAGEQGRGFAVVADEVRTLANRTQNSTQEIEQMIVSLQSDAEQAVNAITLGRDQAQQSVETTKQVSQQVESISSVITELGEINRIIVNDTERQDDLLNDVDLSLQRIVELADLSAESTSKSNQSAANLEKEIADLNAAVAKFKL